MFILPYIIIFAIIRIALNFFSKQPNTALACGIFSWAGSDVSLFDQAKYNILGIFNVSRGKDSCGVYYDGDVYYGIGARSNYLDFIKENRIDLIQSPIVIGHTRAASPGNKVDVDNAHPFLLENEEGVYNFVGCHNGTIYNSKDLAKKYDVPTEVAIPNAKIFPFNRTLIDSEIILRILQKTKNYEVLKEYNGGAALVWSFLEEPNVIYAFKGASKQNNYAKIEITERPLHYFQDKEGSLYISSLDDSLKAVGGEKETIGEFDENTIYIIKDGDIENAQKIVISRENSIQTREVVVVNHNSRTNYEFSRNRHHYNYFDPSIFDDDDFNTHSVKTGQQVINLNQTSVSPKLNEDVKLSMESCRIHQMVENSLTTQPNEVSVVVRNASRIDQGVANINIYNEKPYLSLPRINLQNTLIYNKTRYYYAEGFTVNTLYTGLAIFITGFGFYCLKSVTRQEAIIEINSLRNRLFSGGIFGSSEYSLEVLKNGDLYDDFYANFPILEDTNVQLHYFLQGVKISTHLDYMSLFEQVLRFDIAGIHFDYETLSHASIYPICDAKATYKIKMEQEVKFQGELATCNVAPLGSERVYFYKNGLLVNTSVNSMFSRNSLNSLFLRNYKALQNAIEIVKDKLISENLEINNNEEEILKTLEDLKERGIETFEEISIHIKDFQEALTLETQALQISSLFKNENLAKISNKLNLVGRITNTILRDHKK